MKDFYSFHSDQEDLDAYYEKVKQAYFNVYKRCGLGAKTYLTAAAGGEFSDSLSHEFQTVTPAGEDIIYICKKCGEAINKEIFKGRCHCGGEEFSEEKSIEVGNIFKLGSKYSQVFGLKNGIGKDVIMGCYGIGISRLMGAVVEVFNDEKGIIWPENIAPFKYHLLSLNENEEADKIYEYLKSKGIEVLYDDRELSAGEKFADADLIGIPLRLVISARSLEKKGVEWKERNKKDAKAVKLGSVIAEVKKWVK
jgi:prolyl-tRNA synthetase